MKILFLGHNVAKELSDWLKSKGEDVFYTEDKITLSQVKEWGVDFAVSYNYHYIVPSKIIDHLNGKIINLHVSYLPWNKGTFPNVWSFLYDTPKGVSILWMTKDVDEGDILVQKELKFDENKETLKTSYEKLHGEIQKLFKDNWEKIKTGQIKAWRQPSGGSMYYDREFFTQIEPLLAPKGWDMPVKELKEKFSLIRSNR